MHTVLHILGELNDQDVDWLITNGVKQLVPQGDCVIEQGKAPTSVYIVLEGSFSVIVGGPKSKEIAQVGSGQILGEMTFLEARAPSASVKARMKSAVLAVPIRVLQERLKRDPAFAARFYKALAMFLSFRLRRLTLLEAGHGDDDETSPDELDANVLDTVYLAGARFDRMIKRLS